VWAHLLPREVVLTGAISLQRTDVRPFTDKQINYKLVQTFADQAVIAIENVRLFDEVQTRMREVQESLEYQTAISEVLNVISRSPSDVQPVLFRSDPRRPSYNPKG
jgi:GAF domain-containing protein